MISLKFFRDIAGSSVISLKFFRDIAGIFHDIAAIS